MFGGVHRASTTGRRKLAGILSDFEAHTNRLANSTVSSIEYDVRINTEWEGRREGLVRRSAPLVLEDDLAPLGGAVDSNHCRAGLGLARDAAVL